MRTRIAEANGIGRACLWSGSLWRASLPLRAVGCAPRPRCSPRQALGRSSQLLPVRSGPSAWRRRPLRPAKRPSRRAEGGWEQQGGPRSRWQRADDHPRLPGRGYRQRLEVFQAWRGVDAREGPGLTGTITLLLPQPVSLDQGFKVLEAVLKTKGFLLQRRDMLLQIVPDASFRGGRAGGRGGFGGGGSGFGGGRCFPGADRSPQVQVFRLQVGSAQEIARIINELFRTTGGGLGGVAVAALAAAVVAASAAAISAVEVASVAVALGAAGAASPARPSRASGADARTDPRQRRPGPRPRRRPRRWPAQARCALPRILTRTRWP